MFQGHVGGKIWGIKTNNMNPKKSLRTGLSAALIIIFLLIPSDSSEALSKHHGTLANTQHQDISQESAKKNNQLDLSVPDASKKEQNQQKGEKGHSDKKHAEEEKHKNHLYHYQRVKHKSKRISLLIRLSLKIFVTISYISILLYGFMSLVH